MRIVWLALVAMGCAKAPAVPRAQGAPAAAATQVPGTLPPKRVSPDWELKRYAHSASHGVLVAAPDGELFWASTGGLAAEARAAPKRAGTRAAWLDIAGNELLAENVGPEGFFAVSACVAKAREITALGISRVRPRAAADLVRVSSNRRSKGWARHFDGLYSGPVSLAIADSGASYVVLETSGEIEVEGQRLVHPRYSRTGVPTHPVNAILSFDEKGVLRATLFQDFQVEHVTALGRDAAFVLNVKGALWLSSGQPLPAGRNLVVLDAALRYRWSTPLSGRVEALVRGTEDGLGLLERREADVDHAAQRSGGSLTLARIGANGERLSARTLLQGGRVRLERASPANRAPPHPPVWRCTDSLARAWTTNARGELLALQTPLGGDDATGKPLRRYRVLDAAGRDLGAALVGSELRRSAAVLLDDGSIVESAWRELDPGLELVLRRFAALE